MFERTNDVKYIKTIREISARRDISHLEKKILYKAIVMVILNDSDVSYDEVIQMEIEGAEYDDEKIEIGE